MNRPLVSIVMPVYNAEKYLRMAIESILNQSYTNLEFIVVNDGSTDNSKAIILSYQDARIRFFENSVNCGIVATRNRGLEEVKGKYIAVLDSDDISLPERLRLQVEFLEKNPDYGMCGSYFQTIDENGQLLKKAQFPTNDKDLRSNIIIHNCICHSTVMMRSDLAKEIKYETGFDVIEDYVLWYKISQRAKIINLPVYTTYYRIHGNNVSTTRNNHMYNVVKKLYSRILEDLKIKFSPEELELHANFLNYNISFFKEKSKIKDLENWTARLLSKIDKDINLNEIIIYKIIAKRWIVICNHTRNYNNLLQNKLISKHPFVYLNILYKKLKKQI
jgi:glycosyltransferase involved in cell wall biosynthesis